MDHQTALGARGAPFQIQHKGITYKVGFKTLRMKAQLERWVKQRAIQEVVALKSCMPKDDYEAQLARVIRDVRGDGVKKDDEQVGAYEYGGEEFRKLISTDAGTLEHIRALLGKTSEEMSDALTLEILEEKGDEIYAYVAICEADIASIKTSLGWNKETDPEGKTIDPKALRAAMQAAGYLE